MKKTLAVILINLLFLLLIAFVQAKPVDPVSPDERCAVCGMFVEKYQPWITQLHQSDKRPVMFDGVKDMMAYYFDPSAYGGEGDLSEAEIWVKDYYQLKWMDGRLAYYVVGSDVMGPMGEELIPFDSRDAAENFLKDHKGKEILAFADITADLVMAMKKKHMMKMKKMKAAKQ